MGELENKTSPDKEKDYGYSSHHHLIEAKKTPEIWNQFVAELNSGRHTTIAEKAQKGKDVPEIFAIIGIELGIALDGIYDVPYLCSFFLDALQRRTAGMSTTPENDPRLHHIDPKDSMVRHLEEQLQVEGIKYVEAPPGEGPYTVCDPCTEFYECCMTRSCKLGKPALQLGNTISSARRAGLIGPKRKKLWRG